MRDDNRDDDEILEHLKKENDYTLEKTKNLADLQKKLFEEHISHMNEDDILPPYRHGEYYYYSRNKKGLPYKIHCRRKVTISKDFEQAVEEIILDENRICRNQSYCRIGCLKPSPNHTVLAYPVDFVGNLKYTVQIIDLDRNKNMIDQISDASPFEWDVDGSSIFYLSEDTTNRNYKLWKHSIGTNKSSDICIFTEDDELFMLSLKKSNDQQYLLLNSWSKETNEINYINLSDKKSSLQVVQRRQKGLRYKVGPLQNGKFLILTNINQTINSRLMITDIDSSQKEHWKDVISYDPTCEFRSIKTFKNFVAIKGRKNGLSQIWVINMSLLTTFNETDAATLEQILFPDKLYDFEISRNIDYNSSRIRIKYSTLTKPVVWKDYDFETKTFINVKKENVPNYNPRLYLTKQIYATANDGTKIPISMVYKKSVNITRSNAPTMLYGYGSYGGTYSTALIFRKSIIPYLDHGMVYAIAHVRGGGEMGRYWYEKEGKYLNKRNTFSDFINCAEHLIQINITKPEKLAMNGRSAGGLLVGAVLNMRPDLFRVAIAEVPFVDLMNTMCDPSVPLTVGEWEEWGNPNEYKYFDYMLSYSPYDNVREQAYPNLLITTGLHDTAVGYWEPTKWASKLRTLKTDNNDVLLKVNMETGHGSSNDRYKKINETSFLQSFVMYHLNVI